MGKLTREQALLMSGYIPLSADDVYSSGGSIDIKDSKKGTFTAAATKHGKSVQAFASQVLANKDNYSPAMVKKANFARNASKWKHQDGGAAGGDDQQAQIIAIIQAYAKAAKMDPKDIVKQIDSLPEDQKLPFIQSLADKLQGTQMQEGGPTPEELTGQEQPQGDDQLMQGIQQALQQGATPEELIAELIQQQVDPQMIVQIFVQLGMPQEQVVQVVEAVMQQMGGGQEQEVPQEQMQEQGMEEPMQQGMMQNGGIPYSNEYLDGLEKDYLEMYNDPNRKMDDGYDAFYHSLIDDLPQVPIKSKGWIINMPGSESEEFVNDDGTTSAPKATKNKTVTRVEDYVEGYEMNPNTKRLSDLAKYMQQRAINKLDNRSVSNNKVYDKKAYGGVPQYPYGGLYANNYAANFMPDSKFNRFLTNTNMLSDPSLNYKTQGMAAAGFKPAIAFEGAKSILSSLAGSYAGLTGGAHALFGKKNKPATSYSVTGNTPSNINPMTSSPRVGPQRFEDLSQQEQQMQSWKGVPYDMKAEGGGINNPGFKALPDYVQEKIIANMEYGGLPLAQVGIPPGFDFNDSYGMQSPRFGQTADYADTTGYTNGQPIRDRFTSTYSTPGFVEGMGIGQDGYGGADNSRYNYDPNAQTAADKKLYDDQQALGAAGQNTISIRDKKLANDQGKKDGYAFPRYAPKANSKTLDTSNTIGVSGDSMYNNAMIGAAATSNFIDMFETDPETLFERAKIKANQDAETAMLYNPTNPFGERTPNAGILKPNRRIATQDVGSSRYVGRYGGATRYANGGQMQYQQGGEYHVTHDELLQLMRNGAEVEFL